MGEVYRARDTKLKREVAIKILPDEFAHDPDRIKRFQREAELLASLNHPNIAAIYDLQEANGSRFLVLELVEGATLAERLDRESIPTDEALHIAKNICEALEAAHEKGVIHRDLKPGNVKITPNGGVKVLDFGLAKALEGPPANATMSNSPTLTIAGTNVGVVLGTAAYMSPEQARGRAADQRSDVFSFGCVLYEMLTGKQAFQGEEVSDVLASVLKSEPDFNLLPPKLNPKLHEVLRRCFQKNPRLRWQAIGDARVELDAVLADPRGMVFEELRAFATKRPLWRRAIPVLAAIVLTAVITAIAVWNSKPSPALPVTRFPLILGEGQQFVAVGRTLVAISPDGTQIVYEANRQLYHRSMSEPEAKPIPGTQTAQTTLVVANPVFSPDGQSIVFWTNAPPSLKRIAVSGGTAVTISQAVPVPSGVSWGQDGILFGQSGGIMRVSPNGGKPETIVAVKDGELAHGPQMLPGGQVVLFTLAKGQSADQWDNAQIVVQSLKSGERKTLIERGTDARYVPTGHIVYASGGTLFAVPFDLRKLEVTGGAVPVLEGVRRGGSNSGAVHYSFSSTGSLIYVPGPASAVGEQQVLALMDRKGSLEPLKVLPRPYAFPRVSPDGKHVAYESADAKEANIWIHELGGTIAPRQLTVGGTNRYPIWSADGERVAFQSDREGDLGIFWQKADGTGTAERLTKPEQGVGHIPDSWSPDGASFSFTLFKGSEASVWIFSLKDKKATVFAQAPSTFIGRSAFSPDGRWLAYQSNEGGKFRVWVQPFPSTGARNPIADGGTPFWSRDGKELFYSLGQPQLAVVNITARPSFAFGESVLLPRGLVQRGTNSSRNSDIMPDGKHFIGVIDTDQRQAGTLSAGPQIQVVLNWFEDLKQRMK